ncbi:MAG: S9 family peptidase [Acidimicrobiales bacterium]
MSTVSPYGTWPSPLAASGLAAGALKVGYPVCAGERVFWQEARPAEAGRVVVVRRDNSSGEDVELLPPEFSARTTVHEYGGRAWAVSANGEVLVTSNFADQRLWLLRSPRQPVPITPEPTAQASVRYASPALSPDGCWVVAVRERHEEGAVLNDLVAVPLDGRGGQPLVLAQGHDFYSSPAFSPDGREVAYLCWDHPDMPWDRTELWRAAFREGRLVEARAEVSSSAGESVLQPGWAPDGRLVYISDRTGWWNIYSEGACAMAPLEADFAGPPWAFGESDYAFLADGTLVATWSAHGAGYLGLVHDAKTYPFDLPYTSFAHLAPAGEGVLAVAGGPTVAPELVLVRAKGVRRHVGLQGEAGASGPRAWPEPLTRPKEVRVARKSQSSVLDAKYVSSGEPFSFPTGNGEEAHAIYYPPHNPAHEAPTGELAPLVVTSHGGPTGAASRVLDLRVQFWTTRGFGVVDVDYRGSTGYGRLYRQSLEGRWGLADAEDCAAAARWLVRLGRADPARVVIRGSSASGLTVFSALAHYPVFAAGTVLYGVADLELLAASTHKFESRYIERLVPKAQYGARSPLQFAGSIRVPVLLLHGLDDRVVPPGQSRAMASALRSEGVPVVLIEVEGEGHGFRRASTLARAQEAELAFYGEVLGFVPAGDLSVARADLAAGRESVRRLGAASV